MVFSCKDCGNRFPGCQYVRHLAGCSYAEEVAERLCKVVYELKTEYAGRSFRNVGDKKTPTAEIDFDYEAEDGQ